MSDWGTGARSRKRSTPPQAKKPLGTPREFKCAKCGMEWLINFDPYKAGAMSADGFLCRSCRPKANKFTFCPPPKDLQVTIAETFGAKK